MAPWKNRIVGYANVDTDKLKANPRNWRTHSRRQQDTLSSVVQEIGVVQNIIVNQRTGLVVDGHLRLSLAIRDGQATVPVTYVDLSEAEESTIIATFDPIAALAGTDTTQLDTLLRDIETADTNIMDLLSTLTAQNKMYTIPKPITLDTPIVYEDLQPKQEMDKSKNLLGDALTTTYKERNTATADTADAPAYAGTYTSQHDEFDDTESPFAQIAPAPSVRAHTADTADTADTRPPASSPATVSAKPMTDIPVPIPTNPTITISCTRVWCAIAGSGDPTAHPHIEMTIYDHRWPTERIINRFPINQHTHYLTCAITDDVLQLDEYGEITNSL